MNALDAVAKILREAGQPLHVKEIAERIIDAGLWRTQGKTPGSIVARVLRFDIEKKGKQSRFYKDKPNTFGLRDLKITKSQKSGKQQKGLSSVECAQKVLEEYGSNKPMHYKEITKIALEKGWLSTEGKTPEATMWNAIVNDIKHCQDRGEEPLFVQHDRGYVGLVGLSQKIESKLKSAVEEHNFQMEGNLLERLQSMKPEDFKKLITELLARMGFEDVDQILFSFINQGIDIRGTLVISSVIRIKMAVLVKKLKNSVRAPSVQYVRDCLHAHEQGLIIATSDFTQGAIKEAEQKDKGPVALMNGKQLAALLLEHEIGVRRSKLNLLEIDEDCFTPTPEE